MQKDEKKYVCVSCDYTTSHKYNYDKHLTTRKHKNSYKIIEKEGKKYVCECCDFKTSQHYNYIRHMTTRKHKLNYKKSAQKYVCECGKSYKYRQGLYGHKKTCQYHFSPNKGLYEQFGKQLNEQYGEQFCKILDKKLDTKLDKLSNKVVSKMNTSGNTYNTNNFNLNVFLNETCKDAINMSDFIKNLTVELKDLEFTTKNGIVDSVSNIFVNGLNALEIEKRPIHCTDQKRKTLYIKDENKWEKDNHQILDKSIQNVKAKHKDPIKEWEEQHPNWNESEKLTQEYLQFVAGVVKDIGESGEKKIIKNISNEVQIKELKE